MKHHLSQFDELAEGCGRSNTPRKEATCIKSLTKHPVAPPVESDRISDVIWLFPDRHLALQMPLKPREAFESHERSKTMKNKLKPCPFCGGEAADHDYGQEYWAQCQDCSARGPSTLSRDTADFLWNMRPTIADAAPAMLAALVKLHESLESLHNSGDAGRMVEEDVEKAREAIATATM